MQAAEAPELTMVSAPLELLVRGLDEVAAYACSTCGAIFPVRVEGAQGLAEQHCTGVCLCGRALPAGVVLCKTCADKERFEREARLFQHATKMSIDDYPDQPLYWEGHSGSMGFGFFETIDELCDVYDEEKEDNRGLLFPTYVWACVPKPFEISAEALVALEGNTGVEAVSPEALAELQALLDGWVKERGARAWFPDFSRAVLLEEVTPHS